MIGLDPQHIREICQHCNLISAKHPSEPRTNKAAVILVDIAISDVLQRREVRWKKMTERTASGSRLIQDLEFNRLYALQYYIVLCQVLGPERVCYKRVLMDWRIPADDTKPVAETSALINVFNDLHRFLVAENIIIEEVR
jgi:hypothetical protein